jgi:hypothetical protein
MPYIPTLRRTADNNELIIDGAFACAWGSHVWNGAIPDFVAKPINMNIIDRASTGDDIEGAIVKRVSQFRVPVPTECFVSPNNNIIPIKENNIDVEAINI